MAGYKEAIRQIPKTRDEQLQRVRQDKRYGKEYVESRSLEIQAEAKSKAKQIADGINLLIPNVLPQRKFYSLEHKVWNERLVPVPEMPNLDWGILTTSERFMTETIHKQLGLMSEMAEAFQRMRFQEEFRSAPPEKFSQIVEHAVETGNFALLGMAKQAAANRTEAAIKSAVIEAERQMKLPEAEQKSLDMINEMELFHHQIKSTFGAIMSEGRNQDLAAKVEDVELAAKR
jgi:hypothetical protein